MVNDFFLGWGSDTGHSQRFIVGEKALCKRASALWGSLLSAQKLDPVHSHYGFDVSKLHAQNGQTHGDTDEEALWVYYPLSDFCGLENHREGSLC